MSESGENLMMHLTEVPAQNPNAISASAQFSQEIDQFALARTRISYKKEKAELKGLRQDINERKNYASKTFRLLVAWLLFTAVILFLYSIGKIKLSDQVLIALLTTSSANVIAIFIYVVKYLFNST